MQFVKEVLNKKKWYAFIFIHELENRIYYLKKDIIAQSRKGFTEYQAEFSQFASHLVDNVKRFKRIKVVPNFVLEIKEV